MLQLPRELPSRLVFSIFIQHIKLSSFYFRHFAPKQILLLSLHHYEKLDLQLAVKRQFTENFLNVFLRWRSFYNLLEKSVAVLLFVLVTTKNIKELARQKATVYLFFSRFRYLWS